MKDKKSEEQNGINFNLNLETTPVLYTDNVRLTTNQMGVVLGFGQTVDTSNQVRIVTRIGMSREHAKLFLKELSTLLAMTQGNLTTGEVKKN